MCPNDIMPSTATLWSKIVTRINKAAWGLECSHYCCERSKSLPSRVPVVAAGLLQGRFKRQEKMFTIASLLHDENDVPTKIRVRPSYPRRAHEVPWSQPKGIMSVERGMFLAL